jgi:hypothetical protein
MLTVKDIVASITTADTNAEKPKNVIFVVDESGSTSSAFGTGMNVLEKELSVVYEYILQNPNNNYRMYSFESGCKEHSIHFMKEEGLVNLPDLSPKGSTCTHLPLIEINKNPVKPDIVILLTDGETNSSESVLKNEISQFLQKKIQFEIIAVSATNTDLNTISQAEERRIPGMDLINYLSNSVHKLLIYNKYHKDIPYEGATSSTINKKFLTFMGFKIDGYVHVYLNKLLDKLDEHKGNINFGPSNMSFKQLLSEIGKLLSVYFITFPAEHSFVTSIVEKLLSICNIADMTCDRIRSIIKYGFECTKSEKPILYTNFEQHVKEKSVKHAEFKNAIDTLKIQGTTINCEKTICMPTNGACIINNRVMPLTQSLGSYPKSKDKYGNVYFGCDEGIDGQATRIAFRELCANLGYRDSRGPEPAFYVLNEMSLMYIKGIELNSEHMKELQKLAIIQTSMEAMIAKDKYDGIGLYKQWQAGKTLPTHFSKPTQFHSSLYRDIKINPLKLEEPIWWALMMSMLGLFEEQKNTYQTALLAKGINNVDEFLCWIRDTYKNTIVGQINLFNLKPLPTSVFTLEHFEPSDEVYILKKHGPCDTKTCYSKDEINSYVLTSGCVWCYHRPTWPEFELTVVDGSNQEEELTKIMSTSSKLCVPIDSTHAPSGAGVSAGAGAGAGTSTGAGFGTSSMFGIGVTSKKILINMIGVTGSGKSTVSKKIYDYVVANGGSCLIVSADKWSKKGTTGKQLQSAINKEMKAFDSGNSEYKVIVVDICNENGPSPYCFGFDSSSYNSFNFYPNLDKTKFDDYQCWALRNVLSRPACTPTCMYWLNPESAGVSTCIKVHNNKINGLKKLLGVSSTMSFGESLTMDAVMEKITTRATDYENYLATKNLDEIVLEFVKSTGFVI